jgi:hypothetical protein
MLIIREIESARQMREREKKKMLIYNYKIPN